MSIILPILVLIVSAAISIQLVFARNEPEQRPADVPRLIVEVQEIKKADYHYKIQTQGTVEPKLRTNLISQVSGTIVYISPHYVQGGFFKAGDVLLKVDDADYRTAVSAAQANLARAKATLAEERARAKVAEDEWRSLMKGDAPELYLRKPQLAGEVANLRSAEAELERAQRDLKRTQIKAPFDGVVVTKTVDLGQFLSAGSEVALMYGTEVAEVRLPVSDRDMTYLTIPTGADTSIPPVPVKLADDDRNPTLTWQGQVVRDEGIVDKETRVTYVVAEVADPYNLAQNPNKQRIKFGQFVHAEIQGNLAEQVVRLPRYVLRGSSQILVVESEELYVRDVVIARSDPEYIYISEGVDDGELVSMTSVLNPLDGTAVNVMSNEDDTQFADASDEVEQ